MRRCLLATVAVCALCAPAPAAGNLPDLLNETTDCALKDARDVATGPALPYRLL